MGESVEKWVGGWGVGLGGGEGEGHRVGQSGTNAGGFPINAPVVRTWATCHRTSAGWRR